jgi:hypothetical protein
LRKNLRVLKRISEMQKKSSTYWTPAEMEGEVAGVEGSSIEALVDKEILELVFLSPACLNDSHLRILPLVCR